MGELRPMLWSRGTSGNRPSIATCERLVNGYLQPNPAGAAQPFRIPATPGLKLFGTYPSLIVRGARHVSQVDHSFVVIGNELYQIASDASSVLIGGAGGVPGGGPVAMCNNATQIWLATNLGLYVVDIAAATITLVVTDPVNAYFPTVTYQDGYGIGNVYGTEQWFISVGDDLSLVNAIDFTSADTFPDNVKGVISNQRTLVALGADSIELYANTGAALFPFERIGGAFLEHGCVSPLSIAKRADRLFWQGDDGGIWQLVGNQPSKISPPEIDQWIKDRPLPDESRAFSYGKEGSQVYGLNWSNGTLCYDLATGLWHERESQLKNRWRADVVWRAFGKDLAGDFENGNIYEIDSDTYGEEVAAGVYTPMTMLMQPPPLDGAGNAISMSSMVLDCEMGTIADPTADPQWILKWSDDGGKTWSSEVWRTAGLSGEYLRQCRWNGLGQFRRRTFRLSNDDVMKRVVLGAYGAWDVVRG